MFKKCFQGYEFLHKIIALPADAEYLSSRLIIEENRLLMLGRALGLVRDDAAVERDTAAGDHNSEPDGNSLQSPETCRIVQEVFVAIELQAKIISNLEEKYSLSDLSSDTRHPIPFVRRSFSDLTNNPFSNERAIQRRASSNLWKKNVPLARKTLWAAVDKERLTQMHLSVSCS